MRVDQDDKQRMKAVTSFVLEFYKILMGTFLTAFIPRECADGVCSIMDNVYDDELFHRVAISLNAFSFLVFLAFYYAEISRENWAIEYLDIDPEKPPLKPPGEQIVVIEPEESIRNEIITHLNLFTSI